MIYKTDPLAPTQPSRKWPADNQKEVGGRLLLKSSAQVVSDPSSPSIPTEAVSPSKPALPSAKTDGSVTRLSSEHVPVGCAESAVSSRSRAGLPAAEDVGVTSFRSRAAGDALKVVIADPFGSFRSGDLARKHEINEATLYNWK